MLPAMPRPTLTFAQATRQPTHWSVFWARLSRLAGGAPQVTDWLISQANVRGFHGAFVALETDLESSLSLDDLVVGLLMPHAELDARVIKLVVRILQSGQVDAAKLAFHARRERADIALTWVLELLPEPERTAETRLIAASLRPPRGGSPVRFNSDAGRLIRRPASKGQLWRAKQS